MLLARLHMDRVDRQRTNGQIKQALDNLAGALDVAYKDTMDRISESEESESLAKSLLMWVAGATRPLTFIELRRAVAITDREPGFDIDEEPRKEVALQACAGLLIEDSTVGVIRLARKC